MNEDFYLVDTTSWIYFFRKAKDKHTLKTQKLIKQHLKTKTVVTTGIVLAEFIQGLGKSRREKKAKEALKSLDYLPTSKEIYAKAGELSKNLAQKGRATPLSDCILAAICLAYGTTLVTDDSHFKRFKDLRVEFI